MFFILVIRGVLGHMFQQFVVVVFDAVVVGCFQNVRITESSVTQT